MDPASLYEARDGISANRASGGPVRSTVPKVQDLHQKHRLLHVKGSGYRVGSTPREIHSAWKEFGPARATTDPS
jgi:hypothetical protein